MSSDWYLKQPGVWGRAFLPLPECDDRGPSSHLGAVTSGTQLCAHFQVLVKSPRKSLLVAFSDAVGVSYSLYNLHFVIALSSIPLLTHLYSYVFLCLPRSLLFLSLFSLFFMGSFRGHSDNRWQTWGCVNLALGKWQRHGRCHLWALVTYRL